MTVSPLISSFVLDGQNVAKDSLRTWGAQIEDAINYSHRNAIINGCMRLNQRQATSNADDTYAYDRWNILTQTGTVAVSSQNLIESGWSHAMRVTQSQASAQRFGVEQIIEFANCAHLRGSPVTLSARVRMSASTTLRYAILEWTGTADVVTSDVVNDWTSSTYTAGNFFLGSNLTVTATGSTSLTANTATTVSLSATLGASATNIVVLFWTDSTQAQNVTLDIGKVQLELGTLSTSFERRSYGGELALCERYYETSFSGVATAPADGIFSQRLAGFAPSTTEIDSQFFSFSTRKRAAPTMTFYRSSQGSSAGNWAWFNGSAYTDATATAAADSAPLTTGFSALLTVSGATQFAAYILKGHWTANSEL